MKMTRLLGLFCRLASLAARWGFVPASSGQIWTSCFASRDGNQSYYCVAMYQRDSDPTNHYTAGLLFGSDDAHWRDVSFVAPSAPGTMVEGFVIQRPDGSYVMDHGVFENGKTTLRILIANGTDCPPLDCRHEPAGCLLPPDRSMGPHVHQLGRRAKRFGWLRISRLESAKLAFAGTWPGVLRSPDGVQDGAAAAARQLTE